jgi:cell division septum initiation protein DivIVA
MTEVVYRLYETVDELTTVIENARSVPMSASCMVPRDHLLDLLDDLRESLPEDVQAAGAIVEQRTEILQQAQAEAERLTGRTRGESDQLLSQARRQREEILGTARRQRDELLAQAQAEAEELLMEAEAEAEGLVAEGRRHREALIADAQEQQARLLAEAAADHRDRGLPRCGVPRRRAGRADGDGRGAHARGGRRVRRLPARRLRDDARPHAAVGREGPHHAARALTPIAPGRRRPAIG